MPNVISGLEINTGENVNLHKCKQSPDIGQDEQILNKSWYDMPNIISGIEINGEDYAKFSSIINWTRFNTYLDSNISKRSFDGKILCQKLTEISKLEIELAIPLISNDILSHLEQMVYSKPFVITYIDDVDGYATKEFYLNDVCRQATVFSPKGQIKWGAVKLKLKELKLKEGFDYLSVN